MGFAHNPNVHTLCCVSRILYPIAADIGFLLNRCSIAMTAMTNLRTFTVPRKAPAVGYRVSIIPHTHNKAEHTVRTVCTVDTVHTVCKVCTLCLVHSACCLSHIANRQRKIVKL